MSQRPDSPFAIYMTFRTCGSRQRNNAIAPEEAALEFAIRRVSHQRCDNDLPQRLVELPHRKECRRVTAYREGASALNGDAEREDARVSHTHFRNRVVLKMSADSFRDRGRMEVLLYFRNT